MKIFTVTIFTTF